MDILIQGEVPMSDLYQKVVNTPVGKSLVSALNLPAPVMLERYELRFSARAW